MAEETTVVETPEQIASEPIAAPIPLDETKWATSPTVIPAVANTDPAIEEKDKKIAEEKPTSDKPNEPEKIPTASPVPIQDRPEQDKKDIDPAKQDVPRFTLPNEESEKVFNLLKEGKIDDVVNIYQEQRKLANADKLAAADAIKLNLQYQNKEFSDKDINDLFQEKYEMPEKPVQDISESDTEFETREEKYRKEVEKINNRIERDAKPARTELAKLSKEIVLPEISTPQAKAPTQEELDNAKANMELFMNDFNEGAKKVDGYNVIFKDEEVEYKVKVPVTEDQKKALAPLVDNFYNNPSQFYSELGWLDKDGKVSPKMAEDIILLTNKGAILSKIGEQAANTRMAENAKNIKNIDYTGKRSNGNLGKSPEEAQKEFTHFFANA